MTDQPTPDAAPATTAGCGTPGQELRAAAAALRAAPDEPIEVNAVTGLWLRVHASTLPNSRADWLDDVADRWDEIRGRWEAVHALAVARALNPQTREEATDAR